MKCIQKFLLILLLLVAKGRSLETENLRDEIIDVHKTTKDSLKQNLNSVLTRPVRTDVEEVSGNSGTIEFRGENNLEMQRKIWILWNGGRHERANLRFVMEENNLGENAHLSLWGSYYEDTSHVWNGSQTDWMEERREAETLVLLTLTVKPSADPPSFKLSFNSTTSFTHWDHWSKIMKEDGLQSLSFFLGSIPFHPHAYLCQAVIAPQGGKPFSLTLKYLDVRGTPPQCSDSVDVYFLEESPTEVNYKQLDKSEYSACGEFGNVSQFLGNSTVAILRFFSVTNTETGFKMEVKPNW